MIAILIAFISIIGFFLLYLINPRDVFKVRRVIQNKISKKTSIDRDSEKIIEIFKDQPPEAKPWHIEMLVDRFKDCDRKLINSKSSLYRFFGSTSRIISVSLSKYFEMVNPFPEEVYEKLCGDLKRFMVGIRNKDFKTCYDCIANFVYLSSLQALPNPTSQKINHCIESIRSYIDNFPALCLPPLEKDDLLGVDPYFYIFIRYLDITNHYFYQYVNLLGSEPKIVKEERAIVKKLFKKFILSYKRKNIHEQYRIVMQLAKEPEKIKNIILPILPYISPEIFEERASIDGYEIYFQKNE